MPPNHRLRSALIIVPLALALTACDDGEPAGEPDLDPPNPDGALDMQPAPDMHLEPDMTVVPDMTAAPDMAVEPDLGPPPGRFETVDRCLARLVDESPATGAAVAIVEHGALVHAAGIGHRNDEAQTPVEPTTLFRFGSTLKGMTALAVLGRLEDDDATPDTPVAELLPALAEHADPRWQAVTVHHLLTHQGGFFDHIGLQMPGDPDSVLGEAVESAAFAEAAYFMVDPGTFYNYSNPNFMLAGRVLEVLTDETYRAAMQRHVFEPLGMDRVRFRPVDVIEDGDYARGSTVDPFTGAPRPVPADEYDSVWVRPAGLGWASVLDLARYTQYVITGDLPEGADEAWAPPVAPETWADWRRAQVEAETVIVRADYAHGLTTTAGFNLESGYYATPTLGHDGNINGYTSVLQTVPELGLGVTLLANGDGLNNALIECMVSVIASSEDLPPPTARPERPPEPEAFDDYVGEYVGTPNVGPMIVRRAGAGLELSLPLVDEAGVPYEPAMTPVARDAFVVSVQGLQILLTGLRGEEGGPIRHLRTRFFVGTRRADDGEMDEMGPPKRAIDVEPLRRRLTLERALTEGRSGAR